MKAKFTYADLCAGIGGFRIALDSFGGKCLYSCDVNPENEKTYHANYGEGYNKYDIYDINSNEFPSVDIICAGFPCQPFSIAGKRKGFTDSRGLIYFKIAEIIKHSHPKIVFLENVPNLTRIEKGSTFKTILSNLDELGYDSYYEILDSSNFGVPQSRNRVYIVGFRKDLRVFGFNFTKKRTEKRSFRSIIEPNDYSIPISKKWNTYIDLYTGKITLEDIPFEVPKTRKMLERVDKNIDLNNCIFQIRSSGIRALSIDKPLPTFAVSVSGGGAMIPVYSGERRHISLVEITRLMGFPDDFEFPVSRTNAIKQLANAVCPPVIKSIFRDILFSTENLFITEFIPIREKV